MVGKVEDMPMKDQTEALTGMADKLTATVRRAGEMTQKDALRAGMDELKMVESEVKYGLSYAKASGRLVLDTDTWTLRAAK